MNTEMEELQKEVKKTLESKEVIQKGHTYIQWLVSITVNLATLTYGMQGGWLSPYIKTLQSSKSPTGSPLSDNEISWVGSMLSLAAVAGVPFFSFLADKYGRKICILLAAVLQAIAWFIKLSSANTYIIITARAFSGIAAGGCFVVIPMYVKEISQDNIRGLVGSLLIMSQNLGYFLIYAIGAYLDYFNVLWAVIWLPLVQILIMIKVPESPSFLIKSGKNEEAASAIAFLRGLDKNGEEVQKEIDSMKKEDLYFKSLPKLSFFSIFKNKVWRSIFLRMIALLTIHASNGAFAIVTYASAVLSSSSSSSVLSPELQSLSFPLIMTFTAFASMACVEKFGRRPVLAFGLSLSIGTFICVASVVLAQKNGATVSPSVTLIAMIVNVASFAFGLSPVPFIMMSEMFNFQIRAQAMGVVVTYAWFCSFIQVLLFDPLSKSMGLYGVFYFYAAINLVGLFITIVFLPETKGKTTEQIENEIRTK